jgi:MFS family permease
VVVTLVHVHRQRTYVGLALMVSQAFFYNAIFFTYALVLKNFYDLPAQNVGGYLLPFAIGNVLGPLVLGHLFDTIGRRKMIAATYAIAGILLAITGWLFHAGDGYFSTGDKQRPRSCPTTLRVFQTVLAHDNKRRLANLERVQELYAEHSADVTMFCAHDASELATLQGS